MKVVDLKLSMLAVGMLFVNTSLTLAGVVGPTKPSQMVTALVDTTIGGGCDGDSTVTPFSRQLKSDGTLVPFSIPIGSVFVVTEVRALTSSSSNQTIAGATLLVGDATAGVEFDVQDGVPDTAGFLKFEWTFGNGLAVKSGKSLCIASTFSNFTGTATAYGYITKDK
jgi:hypothetical protein